MAMTLRRARKTTDVPVDMTREQLEQYVDDLARRTIGMSRQEFIALVNRGDPLPDHPAVGHLLVLTDAGRAGSPAR